MAEIRVGDLAWPIADVKHYPTIKNMLEDISEDSPLSLELALPVVLSNDMLNVLFSPLEDTILTNINLELDKWMDDWTVFYKQWDDVCWCLDYLGWERISLVDALGSRLSRNPAQWQSLLWRTWLTVAEAIPDESLRLSITADASRSFLEPLFVKASAKLPDTLLPPDSELWSVAGGYALNALLELDLPHSDMDIFVFNENVGAVSQLLNFYDDWTAQHGRKALIYQNENVWNLFIQGFEHSIQIIVTTHRNAFETVLGFDMDCVQCFGNRQGIVASLECIRAVQSRSVTRCNLARVRKERVAKAMKTKQFQFPRYNVKSKAALDCDSYTIREIDWTDLNSAKDQLACMIQEKYPVFTLSAFKMTDFEFAMSGYWDDNRTQEIRAHLLPEGWLDDLEFQKTARRTSQGHTMEYNRLSYDGLTVVFELEPMILQEESNTIILTRMLTRTTANSVTNPVRECDTIRMLELLNWLHSKFPDMNSRYKLVDYSETHADWSDALMLRIGLPRTTHAYRWNGSSDTIKITENTGTTYLEWPCGSQVVGRVLVDGLTQNDTKLIFYFSEIALLQ